jgi:hypothetical protein
MKQKQHPVLFSGTFPEKNIITMRDLNALKLQQYFETDNDIHREQ